MMVAALLVVALALIGAYNWPYWNSGNYGDDRPGIAVLAFEDHSAGANRGYLSDAIAEGLITELARSRVYAVIARNSLILNNDLQRRFAVPEDCQRSA